VPATDRLEKWKRWIHEDIRHEVVGMYWRRKLWLDVNEILGANPAVGQTSSLFWSFHHYNYSAAQAVAIRRQADRRRDVCSLRRLLEEIASHPALIPGFDAATARSDASALESAADAVKGYVDEHLAHDAAEPTVATAPTFRDLHEAIDVMCATFQQYAVTLTGAWWALDGLIQDDWRAIFRAPWIS
jgi:AbiU2